MLDLIRPDWSAPVNVHAFSTTRYGGVSKGRFSSLNLGENCGDNAEHVTQNRALLRTLLPGEPHWLRQVHGNRVVEWGEEPGPEADAIVSKQAGQVCTVLTADCLPILFCNKAGTEVAACHAGWRGLASGIIEATVAAMNAKPGGILAWLGPAIGPKAYEVGNEVYDTFIGLDAENTTAFKRHGDRWMMDLYQLARLVLTRVGITEISGGQYCTYSAFDSFFSYRRDGKTGRMASMIWVVDRS